MAMAPCCVVSGVAETVLTEQVALEERLGKECALRFGRVLDVQWSKETLCVYFESNASAVACCWRLKEFEGRRVSTLLMNSKHFEVEVTIGGDALDESVESEVGTTCAAYGRVLDVLWDGSKARVAMATASGAAAVTTALDGCAFDGRPVEARLARHSSSLSIPPKAYVFVPERSGDVAAEFEAECSKYGETLACDYTKGVVRVDFATSRAAAGCAASMEGRVFDSVTLAAEYSVKGGEERLPAEFAAEVLNISSSRENGSNGSVQPRASSANKLSVAEKLEKAIAALRLAAKRQPRDEKTRANLAGALLRRGGREAATEALDHAQAAVEVAPHWAWAHFRKGSALMALGDVAKAATSLELASRLAPQEASFETAARKAREAAAAALDPLDAFVATEIDAAAAKDLVDAAKNEKNQAANNKRKRPDEKDDDDDDGVLDYNPRAHCYICKQWGHSKKDCPLARCQYCHEIGHRKADCPLFTQALANAADEEKKAKRKAAYAKKKVRRKEEWTQHLREQTGIEGFAVLYRVLGLPERRLATAAEIKKAYHRKSLYWHPDKHPENREEAHERFLEIKSAYELLLEGMEGKLDGTTVHSAGDLTDAAAAQALQEKVKSLEEKVSKSKAWAG